MIIFENHTYQIKSGCPNENYLAKLDCKQPKWVVDDNSELARKITSTPYWEPVMDDDGNLVDITPIDPPVTAEEQIDNIKNQLASIDLQTARPLRAIAAGTATEDDREKLEELETQAERLRAELTEISQKERPQQCRV